jgi:hypothetical protein
MAWEHGLRVAWLRHRFGLMINAVMNFWAVAAEFFGAGFGNESATYLSAKEMIKVGRRQPSAG